jgi:uncharacterized membrane protein YgaE (UPF0421/DUF939 family)
MYDINKLPKIGMRNIKTAISVMLCIIILKQFSDNSSFYACIASVIVMQNTVESSWKAGISRMIGTLIGAGVGICLSLIGFSNVIITGIGITLIIYFANLLKQNSSISIACIVYLAIMVNVKNTTSLSYTIMRTAETFVGILIAVIVNSVILPPTNKKINLNNETNNTQIKL